MNLNSVFHFVLASTINGSIAGLIIFFTRKPASKFIPHKFKAMLWAIFITKLFFPFGPESKLSVFNLADFYGEYNGREIFPKNVSAIPVTRFETINVLPLLWVSVFIIASLWLILSNVILSLKLKTLSKPMDERIENIFTFCKNKLNVKKDIRLVNQIAVEGVSLFGLLQPKILITDRLARLSDREIEYIFYHELSHCIRKDIFINYLISLIQAIHWFNPLIHIFATVIRQDMELATDEKTISFIDCGESKSYGLTLVSVLEEYSNRRSLKFLGIADSKRHLKERIRQIAHYKRKGKHSICLFLILTAGLSFATLTTAVPVKSTAIPQLNIKVIKKFETPVHETEETAEKAPSSAETPDKEKTQNVPVEGKKESDASGDVMPATDNLSPDARVNALLPGTDFDMMLSDILAAGRNQEYSHNVSLNSSCAVREFSIKQNDMISLGNYTPDYNSVISLYINSSSSQRLNILLLRDGKALINASVKPSKTNSYSFTGLDKKGSYELVLTCKGDSQHTSLDVTGKILIF